MFLQKPKAKKCLPKKRKNIQNQNHFRHLLGRFASVRGVEIDHRACICNNNARRAVVVGGWWHVG
jgi:hypothetical protein